MKDRSVTSTIARNVGSLAVAWVLGFLFIRITPSGLPGQVGQFAGCALGVLLAWRLQAKIATYVLATCVALSAGELLLAFWSVGPVNGPVRFAIVIATVIAVASGAVIAGRARPEPIA